MTTQFQQSLEEEVTHAISYSRFSTGIQKKGTSLERQEQMVQAYCLKHGLSLLDSFHDAGKSGYHGKHLQRGGQFHELLRQLHEGAIPRGTHLLVEQTDRLTRQLPLDGLSLVHQLITGGLTIVTMDDGQSYDRSTDFGKLVQLLARLQRGHDESQAKSDRLSYVWSKKAQEMESGKAPRMRLPFWLKREGDELVIIPEMKALVERVIKRSIEGAGGATIASELNAEGHRTSTGATWNSGKVTKLIHSKSIIGWHTRKETGEAHNIYPPIVSIDVFNQAQHALISRTRQRGNTQKWASALSGLTYCGNCGSRLKMMGRPETRSGVCRAAVEGGRPCGNKQSMRYRTMILATALAVHEEAAKKVLDRLPKDDSKRDELQHELAQLSVQVERLAEAVASVDGAAIGTLIPKLKEASERREAVKQDLATRVPAGEVSFDDLMSAFDKVPSIVGDVLKGDKAKSNELNALLHSLPDFRITLLDGVATIMGLKVEQADRLTIKVSNRGFPEASREVHGVILRTDEGSTYLGGDSYYLHQPWN
ncbi:recombinase family protein [Shewanella sp. AS16]|uniref:recombinase family protein n=1 Tax=Shewanella sp. AS16 TaxID=2907625 RepID=UPI001F260FC3|nr:recombinase family protein [Shewanella sp. AS16]MCE9686309.1 recombinase family protein [Shewanella sp. AS16]